MSHLRTNSTGHSRAPWQPVDALVAGYLALTAPVLLAGAALGRTEWLRAAAHLGFLALTLWGARRRRGGAIGNSIVAWTPLLLIPSLYNELPHVSASLGRPFFDPTIIRWELALFGASPARTLAGTMPWPALSELLHAGYLSYYALIIGPPFLFFLTRRARAFGASAFGVMLAFVCCYAVFVTFPVQGPWFEWPPPSGLPSGPIRLAVERLLHAGSSRGTAFPSSHVAVSMAQTLVTLRLHRGVGVVCAICTLLLAVGAVYGGLHYGIDVLVGAALGTVVGVASPRLFTRLLGD